LIGIDLDLLADATQDLQAEIMFYHL